VVFFVTSSSKSHKDGGTSIANPGHYFIMKDIMPQMDKDTVESVILDFGKKSG
jgi:hypothetical protein